MKTYKEQIKNKHNFVLSENGNIIGTFGNLRKVTKYMEGEKFKSYWTLIRKKEYPIHVFEYSIHKVMHH